MPKVSMGLAALVAHAAITAAITAAPVAHGSPIPDSYQSYSVLVYFGTNVTPVPGVTRVSPLSRTTEVAQVRSGSDPSQVSLSPERTTSPPSRSSEA